MIYARIRVPPPDGAAAGRYSWMVLEHLITAPDENVKTLAASEIEDNKS